MVRGGRDRQLQRHTHDIHTQIELFSLSQYNFGLKMVMLFHRQVHEFFIHFSNRQLQIHGKLSKNVYLTLEQQGFEPHGSTFMWLFVCLFAFSVVNTTILQDLQLVEPMDVEPQIRRNHREGKSCTNMHKFFTSQRLFPLTSTLLKGQLYKDFPYPCPYKCLASGIINNPNHNATLVTINKCILIPKVLSFH